MTAWLIEPIVSTIIATQLWLAARWWKGGDRFLPILLATSAAYTFAELAFA